jgi:hypothetical protein
MEAPKEANRIRLRRAALKREIRAGEKGLAEVLRPGRDIPEALATMPVSDLVASQKQWGHKRARKLLARVGIPELRPVGALTPRQRRVLYDGLLRKLPEAELSAV